MNTHLVILCSSILFGAAAAAQAPAGLEPADLQWKEIIPGTSFAPAYGDWEKGAHGKFVRIAPGAIVPPHTHSKSYDAVFISGRIANSLQGAEPVHVGAGGYWRMPGGRVHGHQCVSKEPCLFYTHSDGAWDVQLVEQ